MGIKSKKPLRVVELFAGVGGFRVGLDRATKKTAGPGFETVWANQWEPASGKNQHAAWVYEQVFFRSRGITDGATIKARFSNEDINAVTDPARVHEVPDHDVLTGGFPCQDYSVARPRSQAAGLVGKKGVLWWSIYRILKSKIDKGRPVSYVFLENVDRLLKSPTSDRGRDFAIILSCLNQLGYVVEWRVVNAGEHGLPQRRRRTFIMGYRKGTPLAIQVMGSRDADEWLTKTGLMAAAFPAVADPDARASFTIPEDPVEISNGLELQNVEGTLGKISPFENGGLMVEGRVYTMKFRPTHQGTQTTLGDIVKATASKSIGKEFYIAPKDGPKWEEAKGAHDFVRTSRTGHSYRYKEGPIAFPDDLKKPSRTIITSEGGRSVSRFKHVVRCRRTIDGTTYHLRRLTPEELEALCMFDRGHTAWMAQPGKDGPQQTPDTRRAFFMGNALVVGVIEQIGRELSKRHVAPVKAPASRTRQREQARVPA